MENYIYTPIHLQRFSNTWKNLVGILLLSIILFNTSQAQVCNYKTGTVTMKLSGQTSGANISSQLVLTDGNGIIKYVSAINDMTIANVLANNYQAIAVTYNNTVSPNLAVGGDISLVSFCNKTTAIPLNVCDCNNITGMFTVSQSGKTNISGQVNKYVLTNGKGNIIAISDLPNFSGYGNGVYNVYGVSYLNTINNLVVGGLISAVNGDCGDVTNGIGYVVCVPELSIAKTGPSVAEKGVNFNYTLTISNTGTASTSGTTVVKDTLASGLSFISGSGTGWACTSATIASGRNVVTCTTTSAVAPGANMPLNLTVVSSVTGTVLNKAFVNGGGNIKQNVPSNTVTTVINEPAKPNLVIAKVGPVSGTVGVNYDYTLTVSNTGTTGTSGVITVTDNLPVNVAFVIGTGTGWTCSALGQLVTCTSSTAIAVNGSSNITLTVNPISATIAGSPAKNIANVSGGGDPSVTPKPSNPVETVINPTPKPNLVIVKNAPVSGTVGINYDYTLTVSNNGNAPTNGAITVTDNLASNLQFISGTGTGWTCATSGQTVTCMSSTALAANASSVITLTVKPLDIASGTIIKNTASVIGGGDPSTTPKPSNETSTEINPAPKPNLSLVKTGPVSGTTNVNYDYTLAVSNNGTIATAGLLTVKDNLPTGLSFVSGSGSGWTCSAVGQLVTCTSTGVVAVSATAPLITLTVKPTQTGIYTNLATAEGGGDTTPKTSNSVTTTVQDAPKPNLVAVKTGPNLAKVGVNFDYTVTVNNTGLVATTGVITVTDNLSSNVSFVSASATGWTCSAVGQAVTCTSSNAIASNGSNLIVITVKPITATVAGSPIQNTAYVSGGGDPTTTPKPSNTVPTDIISQPIDNVSIAKGAPNTGTVGTNYAYTLTVTNGGTAATTGTVLVKDNLQTGLQFVSGSGTGFTCSAIGQAVTCTNNGSTQIPVGQSVVLSIVVKPLVNGVFKNTASITAGGITKPSNETITNVNCPTDINPGTLGF